MSETPIDTNDPRLTAYALGELDDQGRAEIEAALKNNAEARAAVEEIRETALLLESQIARIPSAGLSDRQRAQIESVATSASDVKPADARRRFPTTAVACSVITMVAASIVVMVLADSGYVSLFNNSASIYPATAATPSSTVTISGTKTPLMASQILAQQSQPFDPNSRGSNGHFLLGSGSVEFRDENINGLSISAGSNANSSGKGVAGPANGMPVSVVIPSFETGPDVAFRQGGFITGGQAIGGVHTAPLSRNARGSGATFGRHVDPTSRPAVFPNHASLESRTVPANTTLYSVDDSSDGVIAEDGFAAGGRVRGATVAGKRNAIDGLSSHVSRDLVELSDESLAQGKIRTPELTLRVVPTDGKNRDKDRTHKWGFYVKRTDEARPNTESYTPIIENKFLSPLAAPLSTFSIDVDTASYSNMRRFLQSGQLPPSDAVRIEELVNYFHYDDPAPEDDRPFSASLEAGACPWNADHQLVRIGLKGKEIAHDERPPSNLVFLIDSSGSMRDHNKLPLVQAALRLLVEEMTEDDRIAVVTYAGSAGLVLDSTSGEHKQDILSAIDNLHAGGSTNGEAGIKLAYSTAAEHFYKQGANRVILCTDGDFNVGTTDDNELVKLIKKNAKKDNIFLSIFGFGMGNLKDSKLETLADKGNGQYAYVDNMREAKKVFVEEMTGTLYTIAKDVKLQIEFNPAKVGAYRLIGYENRAMPNRDFNDDSKDAGEIGAGHSVTALYEVIPPEKLPKPGAATAGLKYQKPAKPEKQDLSEAANESNELLTLRLRYKEPDGQKSQLLEQVLVADESKSAKSSRDFDWSAAVAGFGMILRNSQFKGQADFDLVMELASGSQGDDVSGRRVEFLDLVRAAKSIRSR